MNNTGFLSSSINGESYHNDQWEDSSHKGYIKEEDRERKWDRKHMEAVREMIKVMKAGGPPPNLMCGTLFYRVSPVLVKRE